MRDWIARRYDAMIANQEAKMFQPWRKALLKDTAGQSCLEIGAGTGSSIGCWPSDLQRLVLMEPTSSMRLQLVAKVEAGAKAGTPTYPTSPEIVPHGLGGLNSLPFEDNTFDTVLTSLVLCGVPGTTEPLKEIRRVLKDGGTLYFIEHVQPDGWFRWLCVFVLSPIFRLVFCCSPLKLTHRHIEDIFDEVKYDTHRSSLLKHVYGKAVVRKSTAM